MLAAAMETATGNSRVPASNGGVTGDELQILGHDKDEPEQRQLAAETARHPLENRRSAKIAGRNIGCGVCSSRQTNATSMMTEAANPPYVRMLDHPTLGASMMV